MEVIYTWGQMEYLYCKIYATSEYGDRDKFVNKVEEYNISKNDAIIMWQAFDMATEKCALIYRDKINKLN